MDLICQTDPRRDVVRRLKGRNGLDYVEVDDDQTTLRVYFLGKLPRELQQNKPGLEQYFTIEGGDVVTGIKILDVDPQEEKDPERDDFAVLTLDRAGDFSSYTLRVSGIAGIDPQYQSVAFSFKIDCPSDLDCAPDCGCAPEPLDEPQINYLAKDYASFRQLILDRLALLVPDWTERHVPDLGLTLVEVLAYAGDYLSYYQDAVATEAYLGTARQRISVRRHARLVDYRLHEGCNARAWVQIAVQGEVALPTQQIAFITAYNASLPVRQSVLKPEQLSGVPPSAYEWFEPLVAEPGRALQLREAHNEIEFYTWGRRECCLPRGATRASLLDRWLPPPAPPAPPSDAPALEVAKLAAAATHRRQRALDIRVGEVLIFEEVVGARTGLPADADPRRRWAVRVTSVRTDEDPLYPVEAGEGAGAHKLPTPVVEIEWAAEDALPFALCITTIGAAPDCTYLPKVSVARGNLVLVDHGRTLDPEPLPPVPVALSETCCECEGEPADVTPRPARYRPALSRAPLVFSQPLPAVAAPASQVLTQDLRATVPRIALTDDAGYAWTAQQDLLASTADDRDFVAEIDNARTAHLRFGNGELGRQPTAGIGFKATYRVGGGAAGNVGAESIASLVLKQTIDGAILGVRNPLPAQGGTEPEPIEEARLFAPAAFRKQIERAIIADDYAEIAGRDPKLQRAAAQLAWTGSWYEADVAVDPLNGETAAPALIDEVTGTLYRYRRMGHDLRVQPAVYVPLKLKLEVCAQPGYDRGHVKAALLARFCSRVNRDGPRGLFHPDELSFGDGVYRIVSAAQAVPGVECVTVTEFHRLFEPPNQEIANGLLPLASWEIAQLDSDPDHPEHGALLITVRGGR
jgi:hypothetical protein